MDEPAVHSTHDDLQTVGVLGAGVMGRDIAQVIASCGHRVVLVDISTEVLTLALAGIRRNLQGQALMRSAERSSSSPAATLSRINATTDYSMLKDVDFVVENVLERLEAKRAAYHAFEKVTGSELVIAANTSTLPISELAELIANPARVVGIHFMNPATTKTLVEIIPGSVTSLATLQRAEGFLRSIGKRGVVVNDAPGFVSNRVLMLTINEAIQVVEAGTASADAVDEIFVGCFGHAMGPLATADLIGLDTILLSLESLQQRLGDAKFEPASLLKKLVGEGKLGRKAKHGFYSYDI